MGAEVPDQGLNLNPLHWKVQGLNHWTAREVFAAVLLWRDGYGHLKVTITIILGLMMFAEDIYLL